MLVSNSNGVNFNFLVNSMLEYQVRVSNSNGVNFNRVFLWLLFVFDYVSNSNGVNFNFIFRVASNFMKRGFKLQRSKF